MISSYVLQWQSWIAGIENVSPAKPKISTIWAFYRRNLQTHELRHQSHGEDTITARISCHHYQICWYGLLTYKCCLVPHSCQQHWDAQMTKDPNLWQVRKSSQDSNRKGERERYLMFLISLLVGSSPSWSGAGSGSGWSQGSITTGYFQFF